MWKRNGERHKKQRRFGYSLREVHVVTEASWWPLDLVLLFTVYSVQHSCCCVHVHETWKRRANGEVGKWVLGHGVLLWVMDKFCGTTFHDITATCQLQVTSLFLLLAFLEAWWDFNGENIWRQSKIWASCNDYERIKRAKRKTDI